MGGSHDSVNISVGPIESNVKMQRTPGQNLLTDVRQLPSIWTPRPAGNIAEALEGFHSFYDLKMKKSRPNLFRPAVTPRMPMGSATSPPGTVEGGGSFMQTSVRSDLPSLKQRYFMYA